MSSGSSLASSTLHRYTPLRARHAVGLPVLEDHRPHAAVTNNDAEVGQVEGAAARAENGAAGVDGSITPILGVNLRNPGLEDGARAPLACGR